MERIDRYFQITAHGSTVARELIAGVATFLTMAYIIVVNPSILAEAGMDFGAVFVATILAAAISTAIMGLWANWPVALAPGMGLNAFVVYGIVIGMKQPWQVALGAVFLSGCFAFALSLTRLREWVINSIPRSLKLGIGAGIGLFLAMIGLRAVGIVVANPATVVGIGDVGSVPVLLAGLGFVVMVALDRVGVTGSIVIGILGISIVAWVIGASPFEGAVGVVPSLAPTFLKLDIAGAVHAGLMAVVFTLVFVDFFDTAGTLTSVANLAGKVDEKGRVEGIGRAVIADTGATIIGALLGTSNTTAYIESGAGIKEGGRTGLTAVTVAVLFLLCLGFAPLARSIPAAATAPALVFVAAHFARNLADIDWKDATEYAPAVLTAILMPLTYSIANGVAVGFIAYALCKIVAGRWREAGAAVMIIAALSVLHFAVS
ncbi:MAG TPA: NCS2 family permease [Alphaproteobacteria bacterium]|jgi:AGZA family xanthine/uracil permease-like MFS transporter|nr:NCS2 family permease [Alphaproteobacteria bacterium]